MLPLMIISHSVLYSAVEAERQTCSLLKTFFFFFFVWQGSDSKQKCIGKSSDLWNQSEIGQISQGIKCRK